MANKYLNDAVLISMVKEGNESAFKELLVRFHRLIHSLAGRTLHQYRETTYASFEDLISIGEVALYKTALRYKKGDCFESYWRKTATRDMIDYIMACPLIQTLSYFNSDNFVLGHSDLANFYILEDEIMQVVNNPKYHIEEIDRSLFYKRIDGYEYEELGKMYGLSYSTVKRKVERVQQLVNNILLKK